MGHINVKGGAIYPLPFFQVTQDGVAQRNLSIIHAWEEAYCYGFGWVHICFLTRTC